MVMRGESMSFTRKRAGRSSRTLERIGAAAAEKPIPVPRLEWMRQSFGNDSPSPT
jgi:hypothetical protein